MLFLFNGKKAVAQRLTPSFSFSSFNCALQEAKRAAAVGNTKKHQSREKLSLSLSLPKSGIEMLEKLPLPIARMWTAAASNKMLQPHHVSPHSKKLVHWKCPHCDHCYSRRVDHQVELGGQCPQCQRFPRSKSMAPLLAHKGSDRVSLTTISSDNSLSLLSSMKKLRSSRAVMSTKVEGEACGGGGGAILKRSGPHQNLSQSTVSMKAVEKRANLRRVPKSITDGHYLRQEERRILLPMLAKNFEKERDKIFLDEFLYVSPKLDGIRCVVSFSQRSGRLLFFSRAGTMFECCDQFIEPSLIPLFEKDPHLVLDGELYNDSANQLRIQKRLLENKQSSLRHWQCSSCVSLPLKKRGKKTAILSGNEQENGEEEKEIVFDDLVSAVRTTRAKRTPEVAMLQSRLQYHMFDVLYSSFLQPGQSPFSERWALLHELYNSQIVGSSSLSSYSSSLSPSSSSIIPPSFKKKPEEVIRLVPCLQCRLPHVDTVLHEAITAGYEGVMVRRNGLQQLSSSSTASSVQDSGQDFSGGYRYGQRSGTLLKYKRMKDDEFVIVDAVEGKGKWKGCLGAFICLTRNSKKMTFSVAPAISEEQKRLWWSRNQAADLIGKVLTVQYQELTSDGIPRFPVGKTVRGSESQIDWI